MKSKSIVVKYEQLDHKDKVRKCCTNIMKMELQSQDRALK